MTDYISATLNVEAPFYDVDSIGLVWHGNYVKYLEDARCNLMGKIGYSYQEMQETGHIWPIVHLKIKYMRPVKLSQKILITASLIEYENCLKIRYLIRDAADGHQVAKAETMQMAIDLQTSETCFFSPQTLLDRVHTYKANEHA